jgi:hypothetical protein
LRAVRDETPTAAAVDPRVEAVKTELTRVESTQRAEIAALHVEMRRLAGRLERVEDTVELIRESEEAPLAWPVPVTTDSPLEVPPLEVSRKSSPAFDILLGPPPTEDKRDTA